jgi:hypothetical protein
VAQSDAAQTARLRNAIVRYVHRFPRAADTAEGIVTRWLPCTGFECAPDYIDQVLVQMVSDGLLQALLLPDGRTLFRVCGRL